MHTLTRFVWFADACFAVMPTAAAQVQFGWPSFFQRSWTGSRMCCRAGWRRSGKTPSALPPLTASRWAVLLVPLHLCNCQWHAGLQPEPISFAHCGKASLCGCCDFENCAAVAGGAAHQAVGAGGGLPTLGFSIPLNVGLTPHASQKPVSAFNSKSSAPRSRNRRTSWWC